MRRYHEILVDKWTLDTVRHWIISPLASQCLGHTVNALCFPLSGFQMNKRFTWRAVVRHTFPLQLQSNDSTWLYADCRPSVVRQMCGLFDEIQTDRRTRDSVWFCGIHVLKFMPKAPVTADTVANMSIKQFTTKFRDTISLRLQLQHRTNESWDTSWTNFDQFVLKDVNFTEYKIIPSIMWRQKFKVGSQICWSQLKNMFNRNSTNFRSSAGKWIWRSFVGNTFSLLLSTQWHCRVSAYWVQNSEGYDSITQPRFGPVVEVNGDESLGACDFILRHWETTQQVIHLLASHRGISRCQKH